jgi:hypothetical protein
MQTDGLKMDITLGLFQIIPSFRIFLKCLNIRLSYDIKLKHNIVLIKMLNKVIR